MGANKASGGDPAKITNKSSNLGRVLSKLTKQSRKQTTEVLPYSLSNQKKQEKTWTLNKKASSSLLLQRWQ